METTLSHATTSTLLDSVYGALYFITVQHEDKHTILSGAQVINQDLEAKRMNLYRYMNGGIIPIPNSMPHLRTICNRNGHAS